MINKETKISVIIAIIVIASVALFTAIKMGTEKFEKYRVEKELKKIYQVVLPSSVSNKRLVLKLSRCFYRMKLDSHINNITVNRIPLDFPLATFSGNHTNIFNCMLSRTNIRTRAEISPLMKLPIIDAQGKEELKFINIQDYLKSYVVNVHEGKLIKENETYSLYQTGAYSFNRKVLLIKDKDAIPRIAIYFYPIRSKEERENDNDNDVTYEGQFEVLTFLNNEFILYYNLYAPYLLNHANNLNDENRQVSEQVNADFINTFQQAYLKDKENILQRPEVIAPFIENNQRVLGLFLKHSYIEK